MVRLEDIKPDVEISGVIPDGVVTVVRVQWHGSSALTLTYRDTAGHVEEQILYRDAEPRLEIIDQGRPYLFNGDGAAFRLVSEAKRIRLAHLFDPMLAVHVSLVDPLPHQITAVYEKMLPRLPLRFLLADDPGAGKTIMAGLLIKELIARGDLQRCLVVCPGSLAEQWQDELYRRFHLPFELLTNDKLEAAHTGNWFLENNLIIARLDKLARDEKVQAKLSAPGCNFDLIICDEAHKMSARFSGREIKGTKRYKLGQLLATQTRHFLLMTATPHNGKEEDFQLFLALLDSDRFEGRFRNNMEPVEISDLMRRMVKEKLVKFDGRPLFPERRAETIPYNLSDSETRLYQAVTGYVREEFNRAEAQKDNRQAGTVGFALTILQRRLASSPEAIYRSLYRRHERLKKRLHELEESQRETTSLAPTTPSNLLIEIEDIEDLYDEAPEEEIEIKEQEILDQATAASTVTELKAEIDSLTELKALAKAVRDSSTDTKWKELSHLLDVIFTPSLKTDKHIQIDTTIRSRIRPSSSAASQKKLVVFTEHRDTLRYLERRIVSQLGSSRFVVLIHGGMKREDRQKAQENFLYNSDVRILLATDAAGEGINLQRAHLMVNYDLPWNPNRLEQRFGRIHRIGQTEVCYLWNLVAHKTREGDVYHRLLDKLEQARISLGGQVFDVLGKLQFEGEPLRHLLIKAIRYGESPAVRARLDRVIDNAIDRPHLETLIERHALAQDVMDTTRVNQVRENLERAQARRLQPHYIESFFRSAFEQFGGTMRQRELRRYEITHVPALLRNRSLTSSYGKPILRNYERIAFEKELLDVPDKPMAEFVCPGHPLLEAVLDLTFDRYSPLLQRGTVLVDERDAGIKPRVIFYLEHVIQDAQHLVPGQYNIVSQRMLYVELDSDGNKYMLQYAPYLDYRPLSPNEPTADDLLARPECSWIIRDLEQQILDHAIGHVVPDHIQEVQSFLLPQIEKTRAEVNKRLTKEMIYWDHRSEELKLKEQAGRPGARLNSSEARRRADVLNARLEKRLAELDSAKKISARPPVVVGALVVMPIGLIATTAGHELPPSSAPIDTQASAERARSIIMETERRLGFEPIDREHEKVGYDIESRDPSTGHLRFIEVKGRTSTASTITVTKNEILTSLNKPENFILAIVEFVSTNVHKVHYVRQPFQQAPDFGVTSVNYNLAELLARATAPV